METTAKLFKNGSSQAVRLPKECRFDGDEVVVKRFGDMVILVPMRYSYQGLMAQLRDRPDKAGQSRSAATARQEGSLTGVRYLFDTNTCSYVIHQRKAW